MATEQFVTAQMCEALHRLQTVPALDFARAYRAAFGGIYVLDPRDPIHNAMIRGKILAYRLWRDRSHRTLELRPVRV